MAGSFDFPVPADKISSGAPGVGGKVFVDGLSVEPVPGGPVPIDLDGGPPVVKGSPYKAQIARNEVDIDQGIHNFLPAVQQAERQFQIRSILKGSVIILRQTTGFQIMPEDCEDILAGFFFCIGSELSGQQEGTDTDYGKGVYFDPEPALFFEDSVDEPFFAGFIPQKHAAEFHHGVYDLIAG